MESKQKRNEAIIRLHNDGLSTQKIADKVGLSKAAVYKIITSHLNNISVVGEMPFIRHTSKQRASDSKPKTNVIRITNFCEYQYNGVPNEYIHIDSGEVVKVRFVPISSTNNVGYFEIV